MFHPYSTQIGRRQVSGFVKKNRQCYRSPIDRSNKRHGISLMGEGCNYYDSSGSHYQG